MVMPTDWTALGTQSTVMDYIALQWTTLHCDGLHCTTVDYISLLWTTLHCDGLHCILSWGMQCTVAALYCDGLHCSIVMLILADWPINEGALHTRVPQRQWSPWQGFFKNAFWTLATIITCGQVMSAHIEYNAIRNQCGSQSTPACG